MKLAPPVLFNKGRLRSIDALRGFAALSVVLYHAVGEHPRIDVYGYSRYIYGPLAQFFSFGYAGVYLFFVISGFCIHLYWAKLYSAGEAPQINFASFWKRRFRRLYPPYLVALFIYLVVIAIKTDVQFTAFYFWDLLSHLLMIHNWDTRTCYSINGVFWTLAVEEQLYLAYFLLLFLRKNWGWAWTLILCGSTRIVWFLICQLSDEYLQFKFPLTESAASHWFTWALGAMSVEAALGVITLPSWCRNLWVGIIALLAAVGVTSFLPVAKDLVHNTCWLFLHPLWGLGFFIIINRMVSAEVKWQSVPRFITWMATIGLFSYSLYLSHQLVMLESYWFGFLGLPAIVIAFFLVTPTSILIAWIYFLLFEKPFLPNSSATKLL